MFTGVEDIVGQWLQVVRADGVQNPLPRHCHQAQVLVLTCWQSITLYMYWPVDNHIVHILTCCQSACTHTDLLTITLYTYWPFNNHLVHRLTYQQSPCTFIDLFTNNHFVWQYQITFYWPVNTVSLHYTISCSTVTSQSVVSIATDHITCSHMTMIKSGSQP